MTDFDLERLGDVWRQQPDPAELERLQRSAAAVSRRARWTQYLHITTTLAVAAMVVVLVLLSPQRGTILIGTAALVFLLYNHVRSRRVRQIELRSLSGTTEAMLDQSIERLEASLKYNLYSLIVLGPGLVIGVLLAASTGMSPDEGMLSAVRSSPLLRFLLSKGSIAVLAAMIAYAIFGMRRARRELERLRAMRESFREERKSSDY